MKGEFFPKSLKLRSNTRWLFLFILFAELLSAQTYVHPYRWQMDTLIVVKGKNYNYQIPGTHRIQIQSTEIFKNDLQLQPEIDYRFKSDTQINFFSLTPGDSIRIRYRRLPFNLKSEYRLFDVIPQIDSSGRDTVTTVKIRKIKFDNPFGNLNSGMQTSGSIMRGVQIGTNRDFSLNSGLNVELVGKLTDDLEVVAALTDEATPIQPEGNTQTLNEVDKVFVQFKSPYVSGTVGDFNLEYLNSEFANLSRKLQGITLNGAYNNQQLAATVATTRGFFNRVTFLGQEGNQGPYQLTGKNGERDVIVLAGTERIWINGQKMIRGESKDYIIEYGNGQIRFTGQRLITSESRIEVDFEYYPASQKYNRNVYSAAMTSGWKNNKLKFKMRAYRETDDPRQVLDEGDGVSADEKEILSAAGDDPMQAFTPGETYQPDFSGNYVKRDTLWQGETVSYFRYVETGKGDYTVAFSDVGSGKGDYERDRLGVYNWVGVAQGRYLPVRLLSLPSRHDLADLVLDWQPAKFSSISVEYAHSRLDQNILSGLNDQDNQGNALQASVYIQQLPLKTKAKNFGQISLKADARYIENSFQAADRFRKTDFARYWNVLDAQENKNEEKSYQVDLSYKPFSVFTLDGNAGQLERTGFQSARYGGRAIYQGKSGNLKADYESVQSHLDMGNADNQWQRYSISSGRNFWKFTPQVSYKAEHRRNDTNERITGFQFKDYGTRLALYQWKNAEGFYEFNRRFDSIYDYLQPDELISQSTTSTQRVSLKLLNLKGTSADLQLVRREKDFTAQFENIKIDTLKLLYADASVQDTVWQDRTTDLAEINVAHSAFRKTITTSMQYRISSEQTALKEKIYLDVGQGRGNLRYDEDLLEYVPDPDGSFMLFILPSGKFEPVTSLQAVFRLVLDPSRLKKKNPGAMYNLLKHFTSESYFRVEEETKDDDLWSVYLLNLSKYQGAYTVNGTAQFNQDLHIMRRNRDLSFRLRYRYRKSRSNQFLNSGENEDRKSQETELRTNWRLAVNLKGQTGVRYKTLLRMSAVSLLRNRDIFGWYVDQKFSYRPRKLWEFGLEGELAKETNLLEYYPLSLWYGKLKTRFSYSLPENGRASAEYLVQNVRLSKNPLGLSVPYEMARGKKEGLSQNWQARFDYTLAKNIVFSMFYTGRNEAGFKNIIHSGQAEIRAFF